MPFEPAEPQHTTMWQISVRVESLEEAREMFQDGAVLEVVPLLQTFLWPEGL